MGDASVPVTSPIRPTVPDQSTIDLSTPPKQQQQQQQQQQHQQQQAQQQQQQQQPDSSPAKAARSQDTATENLLTTDPVKERKMKHLRDLKQKEPTESGISAVKAPPWSITSSEKSGQLVAAFKHKKKKGNPASAPLHKGLELPAEGRSRVRLNSKVLPELVTPGGVELGELTKFVESWNAVDYPESSSLSWDILKGIEHSVHELQEQLEVSLFHSLMFI